MSNKIQPIDLNEIWAATDGGRTIIEDFYPQSRDGFVNRKNFKLREDDKSPSTSVFLDKSKAFWFIQDKGGSNTKARNAIVLIQEEKHLDYFQALKFAVDNYCSGSVQVVNKEAERKPLIEKTGKTYPEIYVKVRDEINENELKIFGPSVTPDHAKDFNLNSVEYYITKEGYKISSTDDYPIFYYDYRGFGKIYQPYSKDYRFIYTGKKPENAIFSDNKTASYLKKVEKNNALGEDDEKYIDLLICSGPSDAINAYAAGWRVVWMNSETAQLSAFDYNRLTKIATNIYIVPDLDTTGIRTALKIAVKFLGIRIVWLPDDLRSFKDYKGKSCKDLRDFFTYYKSSKYTSLSYYFKELIRVSISLQFWQKNFDKEGKFVGYGIKNEQLYQFLNAQGIFKIPSKSSKKQYSFIHIIDNIVSEIPDIVFSDYVNTFLINFLKANLEYYNIDLIDTIHRTNQLKDASLSKLRTISLDFKSFGRGYDHLFFENVALKVTGSGVESFRIQDLDKYVLDSKIIKSQFQKLVPPFEIDYTEAYKKQLAELADISPGTPEYEKKCLQIDGVRPEDQFILKINDADFSMMRYLYNTGRIHWRKEEAGEKLTDEEKKEHDLHFISKIAALGYSLYRYKDAGRPYAVYAMETEQGDLGKHKGGTGKSFFMSLIKSIRNTVFIDGQKKNIADDKHLFGKVLPGITEFCFIDDVARSVDLHVFLAAITGEMFVEPKFIDGYTIPYSDSPKIGITSNHAVRNFDDSLRRRLWFVGFCDYYHVGNKSKGIQERNMRSEFGKNLIDDYTPEEMNKFYNLLVYALYTYLKLDRKIEPPMTQIEQRNLQNIMGDDFIYWAEEYFTDDKLNKNLVQKTAYEEYKSTLPGSDQKFFKPKRFRQLLETFADYKGWQFNPEDLMKSKSEKERNEIREYLDGKNIYCFHYRTQDFDPENIADHDQQTRLPF